MTLLWIYNLPLKPESGGTERITSLVAKGFSLRGYHCMDILVFDEHTGMMSYRSESIVDLYGFLKKHKVDIVINQIAYSKWLLDMFLDKGGEKWKQEGGKVISCLHFDPKNPSLLHLLKSKYHKTWRDRLYLAKAFVLQKYYKLRQEQEEGSIYNHIYEHSDYFVTLSPTHFPYLRKVMRRADYHKLVAINNPLTFCTISTPDILGKKKNIVLVCARMSEYHKRISLILKTWRLLQKKYPVAGSWDLKIVGEGSDLDYFKEYVRIRKISHLHFEGQQSPEPYYQEASLLLLTSSAEGWGLTITEGLERGVVPVVMNSSPVFNEMIQNGIDGFITPNNDIKLFAEKIACLMTDAELRRKMQLAALKSAETFSLENTMDKWECKCKISR